MNRQVPSKRYDYLVSIKGYARMKSELRVIQKFTKHLDDHPLKRRKECVMGPMVEKSWRSELMQRIAPSIIFEVLMEERGMKMGETALTAKLLSLNCTWVLAIRLVLSVPNRSILSFLIETSTFFKYARDLIRYLAAFCAHFVLCSPLRDNIFLSCCTATKLITCCGIT